MDNPALYATSSNLQLRDVQMVLRNYGNTFNPLREGDRVLDIGCGLGNITGGILMPICHKADLLVGADVSANIVEYAAQHFKDDRLSFIQLDISQQCVEFQKEWGPFARIYSFFCLNWIKDHGRVLRNIASMLSNKGECLLLFVAETCLYEVYRRMAELPEWKPYMMDVNQFIPDTHNSNDPAEEFAKKMESVGLEVPACDVIQESFTFGSTQKLQDFFEAISPFYKRIPETERDAYVKDFWHLMSSSQMKRNCQIIGLTVHYELLVAHGRKTTTLKY